MKVKDISILAVVLFGAMVRQELRAAEEWFPVSLRGQSAWDAGIKPGGEGCQWPQAICVDPVDGRFILYGTDVGGIFRSLDGGQSFSPCNIGYNPGGNCGFAIDPKNVKRCLAVGTYNGSFWPNGLYLSTNQAASWKQVNGLQVKGYRDFREQVVFDPSSYDPKLGYSRVAYWSTGGAPGESSRLYKSIDGGSSWSAIVNSTNYGNAWIKVHPTLGFVYVANANGLFKSTNAGATFVQKVAGTMTGLDVALTYPDWVFACKAKEVLISTNGCETFQSIVPNGLASVDNLYWIHASPVNPKRMVAHGWQSDYNWHKYYSTDGGKNWAGENWNYQFTDNTGSIMPFNQRQPMFAWHPTNELVGWSFGGDWLTKTTNGGAMWKFSNNGNNGVMAGGKFNFSLQNPNLLLFAAVDYTGALTTNGGVTWTHVTSDQYGTATDGYAATPQIMYFHYSDKLQVSRDGGRTFSAMATWSGGGSYGDPSDANILFAGNLRSADQGLHWASMSGCSSVVTHDPVSKSLLGLNGNDLVKSTNKGASWLKITTLPDASQDIAYDGVRNRIYVARGDAGLFKYDINAKTFTQVTGIPANQYGANRFNAVAVDPVDPGIVYAGGTLNIYSGDADVVRSTDAGVTWKSLIRSERLDYIKSGPDGGREAIAMRVHPATRQLWVGTACFGLWRFGQTVIRATIQRRGSTNATISWTGGAPPFVLQSASQLPTAQWVRLSTNDASQIAVSLPGDARYFRVLGQ